jgi:25S rRNA (uracil2634-N3)-methyltransferase
MRGFFSNASHLLQPHGEIHVSHKIGHPYDSWDLEQLASESCLVMFEKVWFRKEDYPGYNQKRGDGARCDNPFKLEPCCKFKFRSSEAGVAATDFLLKLKVSIE